MTHKRLDLSGGCGQARGGNERSLAPDLPLKGYDIGFAPDAVIARIQYLSAERLAATAEVILARSLEARLDLAWL